jgi:hypothetical protein
MLAFYLAICFSVYSYINEFSLFIFDAAIRQSAATTIKYFIN